MALRLLLAFYAALAAALAQDQEPFLDKAVYKAGDAIPVSCLNRTV